MERQQEEREATGGSFCKTEIIQQNNEEMNGVFTHAAVNECRSCYSFCEAAGFPLLCGTLRDACDTGLTRVSSLYLFRETTQPTH